MLGLRESLDMVWFEPRYLAAMHVHQLTGLRFGSTVTEYVTHVVVKSTCRQFDVCPCAL